MFTCLGLLSQILKELPVNSFVVVKPDLVNIFDIEIESDSFYFLEIITGRPRDTEMEEVSEVQYCSPGCCAPHNTTSLQDFRFSWPLIVRDGSVA